MISNPLYDIGYDIGIVGSGPAGSTLARLLADRYRVLLLNSNRQKCCGGILSEKAQLALKRLKLEVPKEILVEPQPDAVTVMDWDNHLVRSYSRNFVNINRNAFDRWLLSLVPQTVDVRNNAIYKYSEIHNERFTLSFEENGEPKTAQVRWLVGADGAFSAVRREFFPDAPMPKRYIAVQHWYKQDAVAANASFAVDIWKDYTGIFDSNLTDFYMWMIPKNQQLIFGGAFPIGTNFASVMQTIKEQKLQPLGLRLGVPVIREAAQILRPFRHSTLCFGNDRIILVGEASGLISPSSAEGISRALLSAFHLAESFRESGFDSIRYRRLLRKQLWSLWLQKFRVLPMFDPMVRKYVMLSGLTALR